MPQYGRAPEVEQGQGISEKGGANLRVCHESRQGFATFSEIPFEKPWNNRAFDAKPLESFALFRKMTVCPS